MTSTTKHGNQNWVALLLVTGLFLTLTLQSAFGDPTGAQILTNLTREAPTTSPDSRADPRATITDISLSVVQQNQNWKAYVGNVTGRLSLDSANGFTIYDWDLGSSVSGEVYVARNQSFDFTNMSCVNTSVIATENTFFGFTDIQSDNINNTYNATSHAAVAIGGLPTSPIAADSCASTATFVNGTEQFIDGSQVFQALILQDYDGNVVFTTIIADDNLGFDNNASNDTINETYDFQVIIPELASGGATTYYFWTELDG